MTLTPEEIALWERLAPKGYRATDQDPATVYLALYGQDTPPSAAERADALHARVKRVQGSLGPLVSKLGGS